ncbi:MAG: hypothetical protein K6F63_01885 [Lachnospiraceae bacterium]|nr:hypothetical protein [Lachnospiraceae bacterium]
MDFEEFIMRLLLILACFLGPAILLAGEAAIIKVIMDEMFKIDFNIWDPLLFFDSFAAL